LSHCRQLAITTTPTVDFVRIEAFDPNNGNANIHDLGSFSYTNELEPSTVYQSNNSDYIECDYCCDDVTKLDLANSFIQGESKNQLSYTEDFSNSAWIKNSGITLTAGQTDPVSTTRATLINFGAASREINQTVSVMINQSYTGSIQIKGTAGQTILFGLATLNVSNTLVEVFQSTITLTGSWQTVTKTATPTNSSGVKIKLFLNTYSPATATSVTIAFPQLEQNSVATGYSANLTAATTFKATLSNNVSTLVQGVSNKIKIKKSSFTPIGSGNWSDVGCMRLSLQTTSSTQNAYYGNISLMKNWEVSADLQIGLPVRFGNAVSSDDGATYYREVMGEGVISQRLVHADDIQFTIDTYLDHILNKTFGDLPSFPKNFVCYASYDMQAEYGSDPHYKRFYYTYFMKKVLGFIFPSSFFDVDLDLLDTQDWGAAGLYIRNLNYFVILASDKIGDVINRLLQPVLGSIVYSPVDNKLVARSFYDSFDDTVYPTIGSQLQSPYYINDTLIHDYQDDTSDTNSVFNYLSLVAVQDTFNNSSNDEPPSQTLVNFGDGNYQLIANGFTTVTLESSRILTSAVECYPLTNFRLGGWNVVIDPSTNIFLNTGVSIVSVSGVGKTISITFNNTNSAPRYLKALDIECDFIAFYNTLYVGKIQQGNISTTVQDTTSIQKYGKQEITLDYKYAFLGVDGSGNVLVPNIYTQAIAKLKDPHNIHQLLVQYLPDVRLGRVIQVRARDNRLITGQIYSIDNYSGENIDFTQTITIRET
jgi:hypothetical protein